MSSGRNNARRRRVILDEAVQQAKDVAATEGHQKTAGQSIDLANSYSSAAKRRGQLKITDLIPKRSFPVGIVIGVVLFSYVCINLLAFYSGSWSQLSMEAVQTLGFSGVGTLSAWFSSLLFLITSMASLQIYGMRKHRCDDYSGHYQVWLFLAVLFSVASINCVVDFKSIATSLTRAYGLSGGNSLVILLMAKMVALTALVIRGVLEIRASKAAFATVVLVWIAYASAVVSQIPGVESRLVQDDGMIYGNLTMIGTIALFFSVMFYARFVYLHANELIKIETAAVAVEQAHRKVGASKTANQDQVSNRSASSELDVADSEKILKMPIESDTKKSSKKQSRKSQKLRKKAA